MNDPTTRPHTSPNWIVVAVVAAVVGALAAGVASWDDPLRELFAGEEVSERGPVVVESVRNLSELSTVEVVQSTTIEQERDTGLFNFATGDRLLLFAVARISAGVDLQQVDPDDVTIDDQANAISLRLPAPEITSIEVDNEQTRVYDRDTGLFTSGDPDLERAARQVAEDSMVDTAIDEGLYERAEESTELAMRELLTSLGWDQVEITFGPRPS